VLREIGRGLRGVEREIGRMREEGVVEECEGDREEKEKRMGEEGKAEGEGRGGRK